jgi:hypothetical protein
VSERLGLEPRPEVPAEVVALVTVAAEALLTPVLVTTEAAPATSHWRFSGRNFGPGRAVSYPRRVR